MFNRKEVAEERFKSRNLVSYFYPKSVISEEFRKIRTTIQFASKEMDLRSMMITSPGYKEGKTTITVNLAVSIARLGKKVLIIDADLRKPTMHETFNKKNEWGLTSIIRGKASLEEAKMHTGFKTLDILTSGPVPSYSTEFLASQEMKKLMLVARENYDYVLYDTPPLLEVTDPNIIADQCDGVILVTRYGKTHVKKVIEAKKVLELSKCQLLGTILNQNH